MTGKPRILTLIPYKILPAQLGGEKGIAVFNEYLAKQSVLTGLTTRNNDPALAKGYRIINELSDSRTRYANLFLYFKVRKLIRETKSTYFLIEHPYFGWLAWLIKRSMPVQWVVHSHNIEYMRSKSIGRNWWKILKWYEGWVYRRADKVFFISEDDLQFAVENLGVNRLRSIAVTYGIEQSSLPNDAERCRADVRKKHGISASKKILLFNGALYHSTNYDALKVILEQINPKLMKQAGFEYMILVCGKGLPSFFNDLKEYADRNVIYAGFVDDISVYFKAADIFLNPILSGGGVKTKAIEALAMNCTVVSTPLGALGLKREVCGEKLKVVEAGKWDAFADSIISAAATYQETPPSFYDHYHWDRIIERVIAFL